MGAGPITHPSPTLFPPQNSNYLDGQVTYWLNYVKESIEYAVCTRHALQTFKTMTGATFALAPALIRSALKVKTAVPQSPMTGMFIIVLPWLYSPLVWVVFNVVFQLIGNWQLLIGLMAFAFGPMAFFVVGVLSNVTRPFDDTEAKRMVKIFEITQGLKVTISGVFIVWGLYIFSFRENSEYFDDYKDKIISGLSALQLANLFSTMAAKYFYTTIVGVDYMLNQILFARKHEVLMQMHEKSEMWGHSTQAKLAAKIHKDYVTLLNLFCKIQDKAQNTENAWKEWQEESNRSSNNLGDNDVVVKGEDLGMEMTDVKGGKGVRGSSLSSVKSGGTTRSAKSTGSGKSISFKKDLVSGPPKHLFAPPPGPPPGMEGGEGGEDGERNSTFTGINPMRGGGREGRGEGAARRGTNLVVKKMSSQL